MLATNGPAIALGKSLFLILLRIFKTLKRSVKANIRIISKNSDKIDLSMKTL